MKLNLLLSFSLLLLLIACTIPQGVENETGTQEVIEVDEQEAQVTQGNNLADLSLELFSNTRFGEPSQEISVWMTVKNTGFTQINQTFDYEFTLTKDGEALVEESGTFSNNLFASDEEEVVRISYVFEELGKYEVKGIVDTKNSVRERNEDNNERTISITIREKSEEEASSEDSESDDSSTSDTSNSSTSQEYGGEGCEIVGGKCYDADSPNGKSNFCSDDENLGTWYCKSDRCSLELSECSNICTDGKCF